jgi:nicotinamidase-related amidase
MFSCRQVLAYATDIPDRDRQVEPTMMTTPERTSLLLMDLVPLVVPAYGGDESMLSRLVYTADVARQAHVDVVHVRVRLRAGATEVATRNKTFGNSVIAVAFSETNPDSDIHPAIPVDLTDTVVTKRRISAFAGSDLDLILRARNVNTLVLAGVATSGVVLSTLTQAADLDYRLVVLSDGCADRDIEVHEFLINRVFPSRADVLTTREWCATLAG